MRRKTGVQPSTTSNQRPGWFRLHGPLPANAVVRGIYGRNAIGIAWNQRFLSFYLSLISLSFFFLIGFHSERNSRFEFNVMYEYMESMINFGREENRSILRIFIPYLKYCLSMSFKFRGTNINHDFSRSFDVVRRIAERKEEKKEKGKIRMRRSIDSHLLLLAIDKYDHSASNYH